MIQWLIMTHFPGSWLIQCLGINWLSKLFNNSFIKSVNCIISKINDFFFMNWFDWITQMSDSYSHLSPPTGVSLYKDSLKNPPINATSVWNKHQQEKWWKQ